MQKSLSYSILYRLVKTGLWVYLGRVEIYGNQNLPAPALFTPNHQNALMDTLVVAVNVNDRQLSFIARSDVFKKGWIDRFLRSLHMIPVYRPRDKVNIVERNKTTFEEVIKRLQAGGTTKIFPEGNHGEARRIRPLKKGFARMAFWTEEAADFNAGMHIVPVGIYFEAPQEAGTDTLILFGKPIPLKPYQETYQANPAKAIRLLKETLQNRLKDVSVHIQSEQYYDEINLLRYVLRPRVQQALKLEGKRLWKNFQSDKFIIHSLEKMMKEDKEGFDGLITSFRIYKATLEKHGLGDMVAEGFPNTAKIPGRLLDFFLLLPVFLYAWLNCIIPWLIVKNYILPKVKDPIFRSTMIFGGGIFTFPSIWMLQSFIISFFTGWQIALLYFLSMPFVLKLLILMSRRIKKTLKIFKYWRIKKTDKGVIYNSFHRHSIVKQFLLSKTNELTI